MNRSKPSSVVGGGEMKRVTSSDVNSVSNEAASLCRSSRSVTPLPCRTGSDCFQSLLTVAAGEVVLAVVIGVMLVMVVMLVMFEGVIGVS
jgi:hypothetical protein